MGQKDDVGITHIRKFRADCNQRLGIMRAVAAEEWGLIKKA